MSEIWKDIEGYEVRLCYSADEAIKVIKEYLGIN